MPEDRESRRTGCDLSGGNAGGRGSDLTHTHCDPSADDIILMDQL